MKMSFDKAKLILGWLSVLLPLGIAFPYDLFDDYGIVIMMSFGSMFVMPLSLYIVSLIDGLSYLPRKHWLAWLLVFHFMKLPLVVVGLIVWYSILIIRGFFSNGIPPPS